MTLIQLAKVLVSLESENDATNFLRGLFTPQEIVMLKQRLDIVKLLKQGVPQRSIARKLGVGIATVTRGAREIKLGRFKHV